MGTLIINNNNSDALWPILYTRSRRYIGPKCLQSAASGNLEVDILLVAAAELQYGSTYKGLVD